MDAIFFSELKPKNESSLRKFLPKFSNFSIYLKPKKDQLKILISDFWRKNIYIWIYSI